MSRPTPARPTGTPPAPLSIELLVGVAEGAGGRSEVQAVLGAGERAHGVFHLDIRGPEMTRLTARVHSRQAADDEVMRLGSLMFDALFQGAIGAAYREARGRARGSGTALRVVLTSATPAIDALPWEFLYDSSLGHFLALTPDVRLTRNLPSLSAPHPVPGRLPLRVLVAAAGPATYAGSQLSGIDVAAERALIEATLAPLVAEGHLQVTHISLTQPRVLLDKVRRIQPHIFHYIGHAGIVDGTPLLFCGPPGGEAVPLSGTQIAATLGLAGELQLVLLNTCWGGQAGITGSLFGLAPAIAAAGVPAVVGWQTGISDRSAPPLAGRLYEELARGASVDEALTIARLALYADPKVERLAWGLAVAYLRTELTRIVTPQPKTWQLLVIDDEQIRADLLRSRLTRRGLEVTWANGGEAGLERARQMHPDVIVLDLKMPGMDGFQVLHALKSGSATANIPVVVLSSLGADYETALRAYTGGAQYVIPYNGRLDQLEQVLRGNLNVPLD
ncbi:MAG: CHAT domain-containing protein [Chloroflexia bacterium]